MNNLCPQCGAPTTENAVKCEYCGASLATNTSVSDNPSAPQPQIVYVQQPQVEQNPERANWPIKSKIVAGILALILGTIGVHKFYLGKTGKGILYILFCWTYIPTILSFIEGLTILCSKDENFEIKYKCRIG